MCCLICLLRALLIHNTPKCRTHIIVSTNLNIDGQKGMCIIITKITVHITCIIATTVIMRTGSFAGWCSGNRPSRCAGALRSPRRPLPVRGFRVFSSASREGRRVRAWWLRLRAEGFEFRDVRLEGQVRMNSFELAGLQLIALYLER